MVEIKIGTQFVVDGVTQTVKSKCKHPNYKGCYSCLSHQDSGTPKLTNFRGSEIQKNLVLDSSKTEPLTTRLFRKAIAHKFCWIGKIWSDR